MLEAWQAFGTGIGWVDLHLLVSAYQTNALLWTRDRRLGELAVSLNLSLPEP